LAKAQRKEFSAFARSLAAMLLFASRISG